MADSCRTTYFLLFLLNAQFINNSSLHDLPAVTHARQKMTTIPSTVICLTTVNEEGSNGREVLRLILKNVAETSETTLLFCVACRQQLKTLLHMVSEERKSATRLKLLFFQRRPCSCWDEFSQHPKMICSTIVVETDNVSRSAKVYGNVDGQFPCLFNNVMAEWEEGRGFKMCSKHKASDFQNMTFHVTMNEGEGFFLIKERDEFDNSVTAARGIDYKLLETLAEFLNFRFRVTIPPDKAWGTDQGNNTWTGMIGEVQRKEVDFALSQITVSEEREKVVAFSVPYLFDDVMFVTPTPKLKSQVTILARPFSPLIWGCLLAIVFFSGSVFVFIQQTSERLSRMGTSFRPAWYLLGTFGIQGNQRIPSSTKDSTKIFIGFWWLFVLNMLWAYSGTLTSFISMPVKEKPVDTLEELWKAVESGHYHCGTVQETAYYDLMQDTSYSLIRKLGLQMAWNGWTVPTMEEGLKQACGAISSQPFALVDGEIAIRCKLKQTGIRNLTFSTDDLFDDKHAIAFQQGFPYVDTFDLMITRILYSGLMGKWLQDQYAWLEVEGKKANKNQRQEDEAAEVMGWEQLRMAFFLLLCSHSAAVVILILEFVFFRFRFKSLYKKFKFFFNL